MLVGIDAERPESEQIAYQEQHVDNLKTRQSMVYRLRRRGNLNVAAWSHPRYCS
jgi:hypothetical protein